jgi:ferrochelatase
MSASAAEPLFDDGANHYDALLVLSFGGPEGPDDVLPFLENVFLGLRVTDETKQKIAARYQLYGGISPINAHTRDFIKALEIELRAHGSTLPVYWGNRNWHPMLGDTIAAMARDGIERAAVYVTSTFSSYSGCRKYREDLFEASRDIERAPKFDKLRMGFNHPGFIDAMVDQVSAALARIDANSRASAKVLFTAHSLPVSMAAGSCYVVQLKDACQTIAARLKLPQWELVYQSNNARYGGEAWLGPDIAAAIETEHAAGVLDVIVAPVGFVCDHMEVVLDLDVDAAGKADALGINMVRAATVGTHPSYVRMVRELLSERMTANPERPTTGALGPKHDHCPSDCCLSGRQGAAKPALCESAIAAYGEPEATS